MKKVLFIALLLPVLAVAQFGHSGGGSLDLDELLPIIADSAKWTDGSTVNAIKPRDAKTVEADSAKFGALEVTGNTILDGNLTMVTTATEQVKLGTGSDAAPELSSLGDTNTGIRIPGSDLIDFVIGGTRKQRLGATGWQDTTVSVTGIRNEGPLRQKGASTFGETATPATITAAGAITGQSLASVGKTVAGDSLRVEKTSLLKGAVTATDKMVVEDSLRTNMTSKLIGNTQIGAGTPWFTAEDSLIVTSGATTNTRVRSMADGAEYVLPTGIEGFGEIKIGAEYAHFIFESDGTVTLLSTCTANVGTTDGTDDKLNIYDGGTGIVIENQLGSTLNCLLKITYMTP